MVDNPQDDASQDSQQNENVMRFKRSHVYSVLLPLAFVIGLATGYVFWGRESPGPDQPTQVAQPRNPQPQGTQQVTRFEVSVDDDPSLGASDAPVVIVEFSDFSCVYCRKFHTETFPQLMDVYGDQILFVYRDFPILSPESMNAAQAAQCAQDQDRYWEFHDKLFTGNLELGRAAYETYAQQLGMDSAALLECLDSGKYEQEVTADATFVRNLGAGGTPTFFINGIPLVGAQPFSNFATLIEQELNQ